MMETSSSGAETSTFSHTGNQISDGFIDTILKLSAENKFNEKNCWSFPIRDSLVFYERRQENSMSSLIKAGSLAEACTKIYGFRVDSVYNNVKSTYLRLKENNDETQTENDIDGDHSMTDLVGEEETEREAQKKKKKAAAKKRKSDFISKEKASLLAPISVHPRGNLILDSKNKRAGETNFVEGLLQNILGTRDYVLQLDPATRYWDKDALPSSDVNTDNLDDNIDDYLDDVIGFAMPPIDKLKSSFICPSFHHFDVRLDQDSTNQQQHYQQIAPSDKVIFDMDEPMLDIQVEERHNFDDNSNHSNSSMGAVGFDDNNDHLSTADEPCNLGEHFNENNITDVDVERFIEKNGGWSDVQPDQYGAVKRYMVRMAKNTRSTDGSNSGIKFTDFYESYWAGPAYWKFKKARASVQPRPVGQKRATGGRQKKDGADRVITMCDTKTLKFVPIEYKNRELDPRKVDPKNVIMPKNLNISRTIITNLTHTPWMSIYDIMGTGAGIQTPPSMDGGGNSPGHYPEMSRNGEDNDFGPGFGSDDHNHNNHDDSDGPNRDGDMGADEMEHEDHLNISHLSAHLEGAPVKSEAIILPYSKINKNIDMYELKQSSKKIIANHTKEALKKNGGAKKTNAATMTLQELYKELPPELSKENAGYLSLAITFSALLHVAHEESFYLRSANDYETVEIL